MSTTTMNLPCTRFVKRVNNGALGSKYSYIAMMADIDLSDLDDEDEEGMDYAE